MIAIKEANSSSTQTMGDLIGQYVGKHRVDALLGEGNMGSVYQAWDVNLARKVVLKVMHRQLANHESFQQRFIQEAQAAARLDHPSIVKIYSFDTEPNLHMVMEFVEGPSLGEYLKHQHEKQEVVNLDTVLRLIAQVAEALDYAHERGVIHRDIKPSNILLKPLTRPDRDGDPALRVVVTDFGLAKLLEGGMHTLTGTFMGTLSYMSPEQCLGRDLDGRSDIYSLGIVLYQLTTGQLPFNVKSPTDAIRMHVKEIPPAPRLVRPGLPEAVEKIVLQSIAKNPASRFQTGAQFANALRRIAHSLARPGETFTGLIPGTVPPAHGSQFREGSQVVPQVDQMLIYHAGEAPRVMNMVDERMMVGRGQENEVVLPDKGVSRHHLRIEKDEKRGWNVIDLGSTNGTFLDKVRLLPETGETWPPETELRIGPYSLQWQEGVPARAQAAAPQPISAPINFTPADIDFDERPSQTSPGEIEIVVDPSTSAISAGDAVNLQVMLVNRGPIVEHVSIRVEKLSNEWAVFSQDLIKLMPGSRGFVRLTIDPPRNSTARSGTHSFQVVATPMSNPDALVAALCQINVESFSRFEVYLSPKPLKNEGRCEVQITNEGNADATYVITGVGEAEEIEFLPENVKVRAQPGESSVGEVDVAAVNRPLMGAPRRVPFELEVWSAGAGTRRVRSEIEIRPKIPVWVMVTLVALALSTAVFLALWVAIPR